MNDLYEKLQSVLNDKDSMAQISELAKMLGGNSNSESDNVNGGLDELSSLLGGRGDDSSSIDPASLMKIGTALQKAGKNDNSIGLLLALRPMLGEEKQKKIDRIISVFKLLALYPALKESGVLGGDLLGLFK